MTTTELTYRAYKDSDLYGILRLWEESSGWGGITADQFNEWYMNTPYGNCEVIVVEHPELGIVGQIVFSPTRILAEGKEIKALRAAAPILHEDFRGGRLQDYDHPGFTMVREGYRICAGKGYQFAYKFPSMGWVKMLRLFPRLMPNPSEAALFDCYAFDLADKLLPGKDAAHYQAEFAGSLTEEYDQLWEDAVTEFPIQCGIVRKRAWLQRAIGGQLIIETRCKNDQRLVGYVAINKSTGLMMDYLARNHDDLDIVFQQSIIAIQQAALTKTFPFASLKLMYSNVSAQSINNLGFAKDNYRFAYGGYLLDTSLLFEKLKSSNWYMTPLG